jgi:hypothetical protein
VYYVDDVGGGRRGGGAVGFEELGDGGASLDYVCGSEEAFSVPA